MWFDLIGSRIVLYQGAITGARNVEMLTATLWDFLDDLNLRLLR